MSYVNKDQCIKFCFVKPEVTLCQAGSDFFALIVVLWHLYLHSLVFTMHDTMDDLALHVVSTFITRWFYRTGSDATSNRK